MKPTFQDYRNAQAGTGRTTRMVEAAKAAARATDKQVLVVIPTTGSYHPTQFQRIHFKDIRNIRVCTITAAKIKLSGKGELRSIEYSHEGGLFIEPEAIAQHFEPHLRALTAFDGERSAATV